MDSFLPKPILLACSLATEKVERNGCLVPSSGNLLCFASFNNGTPSLSVIIIHFNPVTLKQDKQHFCYQINKSKQRKLF